MLWVGIFALAGAPYAYRDEIAGMAGMAGKLRPGVTMIDAKKGTTTFQRGISGHFELNATINGHTTPMIFDTGASAVALTIANADAEAAWIDIGSLRFAISASSDGPARVRLDLMEVGGISHEGIAAFVAEADAPDMSLLGMTFLEILSRYSVTQNALKLQN
ncbi:MAG: TIGR02281 family clan AA aspartic protease [Candidatus Devosia symbiotica]|nr:TIGR02281 family clan AA aspartic protease [Candidatus Devosia symbiotica]